jgi:hypothetical protein
VLDLQPVELVQVAQVFLARVPGGHAQDLSSPPFSSRIRNMPIGRPRIGQPGNVGSSISTSASSGSPSSPRVSGMNP